METQNQVGQSLRGDFARLQRLLANEVFARRSEVANRVCEVFGFGLGRLQRASCLRALAELEAAGRISLPSPTHSGGGAQRPRCLGEPVPPPKSVPEEVGAVEGLELVPVRRPSSGVEHDAGGGASARRRSVGGLPVALWGRRMAGWGLSGSRRRRTGLIVATDGSAGTTSGGALACTGSHACRVSRPGVECRTSHVLSGVVHRVGDEARYGYRPSGDL